MSLIASLLRYRRITQPCLLVSTAIVISSCTSYQRAFQPSDQPPPARQKLSQKTNSIDTKQYKPLSSHEGFEQEGYASSYGQEFHGRKTSNGEIFDINAMTAAHKTLPMGVYVRVKLMRNGNEVVVRINDRGPFVKDRIIDLSGAAAARLGILREGISPVKITALGYRMDGIIGTDTYRPATSYDAGTFSVQVGAFTIKANAYRYADELKKDFAATDVREALVNGTRYYRVRAGHYTSLQVAQTALEGYERKGLTGCFIVAVD